MAAISSASFSIWDSINHETSALPFVVPLVVWIAVYTYCRVKGIAFYKWHTIHNVHNVVAIAVRSQQGASDARTGGGDMVSLILTYRSSFEFVATIFSWESHPYTLTTMRNLMNVFQSSGPLPILLWTWWTACTDSIATTLFMPAFASCWGRLITRHLYCDTCA